jgi:hypothetical protein
MGSPEPLTADGLARVAGAQAGAHLLELAHNLRKRAPPEVWMRVHSELARGYFGLAALHARRHHREPLAFDPFCVELMKALSVFGQGEMRDAHQAAFQVLDAFEEVRRLYVRGEPSLRDQQAAHECAALLHLDFKNERLMLCGYVHIRVMRILEVLASEARFLEVWRPNVERVGKAWKTMNELFPAPDLGP